ncbi:MAG: hypothetical protein ACRDJU_05305 [Actinomycetota bacterium]
MPAVGRVSVASRIWRAVLAFTAAAGLTIQAGLSAGLGVFWFQHPASFGGGAVPYSHWPAAHSLLGRAGAPIFLASLAAWILGFIGLCMSRWRIAPGVLIGAGLLSAAGYWLTAVVYPGPYGHPDRSGCSCSA